MRNEVWGTFSVKDHCRANAFASELLLYDRLVVPFPADAAERDRWSAPNADDLEESWDPDRLDRLLRLLGTQLEPNADGARLVHAVPWTREKWEYERSRLEATGVVSDDAFWTTRRIVSMGEEIPAVVDAVTAYPSADACVAERELELIEGSAREAQVGVVVARPLLVPPDREDPDFRALREAIDLVTDADFVAARDAYYGEVRGILEPLQKGERDVDAATIVHMREQVAQLIAKEREVVARHRRLKRWRWAKHAFAVLGLGAAGVAAVEAGLLPVLVASSGILGWVAGRVAAPPPGRPPLTGGSMFVAAERGTSWLRRR